MSTAPFESSWNRNPVAEKFAYYFGFAPGSGHFLQGGKDRLSLEPPPGSPWKIEHLDGGLLRNRQVPDKPDGRVHWTCGGRPDCWFAFVWWDRSGDKRGACNSGFYVKGFQARREDAQPAFEFACVAWPRIVARQLFPLVLQEAP
ncbi:hypothetical protein LCGC14_0319750 [marine sediment metagenome]|uniref:Uncharacterized protein n=1 Tax=marine sediment metagenome TaxID=412755 RepID=A0A0F9U245_9ZZZZ